MLLLSPGHLLNEQPGEVPENRDQALELNVHLEAFAAHQLHQTPSLRLQANDRKDQVEEKNFLSRIK